MARMDPPRPVSCTHELGMLGVKEGGWGGRGRWMSLHSEQNERCGSYMDVIRQREIR